MANRIAGNVYIVDSSMLNIRLPFDGKMNIASVAFWGATTLAVLELTAESTLDVVVKIEIGSPGGGTESIYVNNTFDELKVLTMTAGTAWIYLQ